MAVMIPTGVPPETPSSERRVFEKLRTAKGSERWTVLHSLALSSTFTGQYGEIDFLVLIPNQVIICIEVKGGGVSVRDGIWSTVNAQGAVAILKRSPFSQAKEGMWKLLRALDARFGRGANEVRCPVGWMVAFPDVACPPLSPEFSRQEVIDAGDMSRDFGEILLRAPSLASAKLNAGKVTPSDNTCRSLVEFLRPSFERAGTEASRVWDAERRIVELTTEQFDVLEGLLENDRVLVHGAAGTGKTLLAIEAARRFAEGGASVLLTCFNRRLGSWLRESASAFGPGSVVAGNLHKILLDDVLRSRYASEIGPTGELSFDDRFINLAALAQIDLSAKFDIVIVDEVQDFNASHLRELLDVWSAAAPECRILLFGDLCRQALYEAGGRDRRDVTRLIDGLAIFGLTVNRRNTRRIARTMDSMTGLTGAKLSDRAPEGEPVSTTFFTDGRDLVIKVNERLSDLKTAGYSSRDIIILGPKRFENSSVGGERRLGGFEVGPVETVSEKGVGYATIHSYKGLEKNVVMLVDICVDDPEGSDALLYVGMSRAKLRLFIFVAESSRANLNARMAVHLRASLGEK